MNVIPYGKQQITQEDIEAVISTLKSDFLTQGPKIAEFEKLFSEYIGSKYAVAVSNGTAALHLSVLALNIKPNDKVITTPITFVASANCVRYCGGEVVFSDIDPYTFLLDINKVRDLLEKHPKGTFKGIIPVDFAGYAVDLEEYRKLADEYDLWLIEDACHAPGGFFSNSKGVRQYCGNGNYADLSIFSFHPVKHIATGEGGMITTNRKDLYEKLKMLRTHGITKDKLLMNENHGSWYYEMQELGYNYRLTDIQAALGSSQLRRAAVGLEKRKIIAQKYDEAFKKHSREIISPVYNEGHAFHLYIIQVENRVALYNYLHENSIFVQVHYVPAYLMPFYRNSGNKAGDFPASEKYYSGCISLPMYPSLSDAEQEFVINKILEYVRK